jgi:hypothetical protein
MEATMLSSEVTNEIWDDSPMFLSLLANLCIWVLWGAKVWAWIKILFHTNKIKATIKN